MFMITSFAQDDVVSHLDALGYYSHFVGAWLRPWLIWDVWSSSFDRFLFLVNGDSTGNSTFYGRCLCGAM